MTFELENKEVKSRFLEKIFIWAIFCIGIVLGILFLILSNSKMNFLKLEIFSRSYIFIKAIWIIKQAELVGKKEFTVTTVNAKDETYVVYVISFTSLNLYIYRFWYILIEILLCINVCITVFDKYISFVETFFLKLAI